VNAPPQRGEIIRFSQGFTVIDDSYNSNPDALLSMVKTLVEGASPAERKIVVAGEMLELGDAAADIHRHTGLAIASMDVDVLIGVRGLAKQLVSGAANAGFDDVRFAGDSDAAGQMLADIVRPGDVVLVKGSRGVKTEKVIAKLLQRFGTEGNGAAAG
jgi:UDP-N-acetylmuramoyl-tripeptide--D-alanyl-D-alanine ligase